MHVHVAVTIAVKDGPQGTAPAKRVVEPETGVRVTAFRFTGSRPVRLTLRYTDHGGQDRWEMGTFPISEEDLAGLQKELNRWLDGPEELLP